MARSYEDVLKDARELSEQDQELLSLELKSETDRTKSEYISVKAEEAERRLEQILEGKVKTVPLEKVMENLNKTLDANH